MKYYICTFGCQMNKNDSQKISKILERFQYQFTDNEKNADLIIVNMCSVRQSAVDRIFGLKPKLEMLKKNNPKLKTILTGCFLAPDQKKFSLIFDYVLSIKTLTNWPKILGLKKLKSNYSFSSKITKTNKFSAFVSISNGILVLTKSNF